MSVAFSPGQEIGRGDLDIFLTNSAGNPANAAEIYYDIYYVDTTGGLPGQEVLIAPAQRTPVNPSVGEYYAALAVPPGASPGDYRIRWTFRELPGLPLQGVVQEFAVVDPTLAAPGGGLGGVGGTGYSAQELQMIRSLRILLRDNNPDRNYKFRPPEQAGVVRQYNQIFGFIWEDYELVEYLVRALAWFNMFPPSTGIQTINNLVTQTPQWTTAILMQAIVHATMALSLNWIADEFDYSIGGISLSIEKSSKYESIKQNAESQVQQALEAKQQTVKFIRGVAQPRYGMGIRSAFGPHVGRGVLSPRSFV